MLGASVGHLLELPHKMQLSAADYLTVQQTYQGWNRLGFAIVVSLSSSITLAALLRANRSAFVWLLTAISAIAVGQVVFWTWTFPVNTETQNWTILPEQWMRLRSQWEYSHAAGAALTVIALLALALAALRSARVRKSPTSVPVHKNWKEGRVSIRRGQVGKFENDC